MKRPPRPRTYWSNANLGVMSDTSSPASVRRRRIAFSVSAYAPSPKCLKRNTPLGSIMYLAGQYLLLKLRQVE